MTTIGAPPEKITQQFPADTTFTPIREITVAHSPDSDDAFMFYGLATNKVRAPGLRFQHTLCDIESLNRKAMDPSTHTLISKTIMLCCPVEAV